jgi:hypothetical protein
MIVVNVGKQKGFSAVDVVVVVLVLAMVGLSSWWGWRQVHIGAPPGNGPVDTYAGWGTYTSYIGRFTLRYPTDWQISGFHGEVPVGPGYSTGELSGKETQIRLTHTEDAANQFGMDIMLSSDAGSGVYADGSLTRLDNGLTVWTASGGAPCPSMQLVSGGRFLAALTNGTAISLHGSFCWNQRSRPTYSYSQQVSSVSFRRAKQIIESLQVK